MLLLPDVEAGLDTVAVDAGAALGRVVVGLDEEEEVDEEDEGGEEEEVVADFTLSPRGRAASTPVGRFCNRQED